MDWMKSWMSLTLNLCHKVKDLRIVFDIPLGWMIVIWKCICHTQWVNDGNMLDLALSLEFKFKDQSFTEFLLWWSRLVWLVMH